jgi:hypothetical protein
LKLRGSPGTTSGSVESAAPIGIPTDADSAVAGTVGSSVQTAEPTTGRINMRSMRADVPAGEPTNDGAASHEAIEKTDPAGMVKLT